MITVLDIANLIAPWIIFLGIPTSILVCGIFSFLIKVNRLLIGVILLLIGLSETLFFSLLIEANLSMSHHVPIGIATTTSIALMTIIVGIISLYKSKTQ